MRIPRVAPLGLLAGLFACAAAGAGTSAPPGPSARPEAYHGVVVWMAPAADTVAIAFRPEWRREAAGADSVWAFARARMGEEWAYGRMEGDSLLWGIAGMAGDAGYTAEFAGAAAPDGTVSGCLRPPRRGWAPAGQQQPRAAFVLGPAHRPAPSAADAPVDRCR